MKSTTFTQYPCTPGSGRLRDSAAVLHGGYFLTIGVGAYDDRLSVGLRGDLMQSHMAFTAEQARAVAAELMACADAMQKGA